MKTVISIFALALFCCANLSAQQIVETPEVSQFMDYFIKMGKEEPYIDGWRIKLISTTDRRALESAKWLLEKNYPNMVYELQHEAPYYSMKIGAYETRIDVEPHLAAFKEDFPFAIPFRDKVMKIELLRDVSTQ